MPFLSTKTTLRWILLVLTFVLPSVAHAASVCGSFRLLDKKTPEIVDFIQNYSLSVAKERRTCGLPGEEFPVCQACVTEYDAGMLGIVQPVFAQVNHRHWHNNWHQFGLDTSLLRLLSLGENPAYPAAPAWQKNCPILRPRGPAPDLSTLPPPPDSAPLVAKWQASGWLPKDGLEKFVREHNVYDGELAGEDFLYMHRVMIKMMQLELSYYGKACVVGWKEIPKRTDDPSWPVPAKENGVPEAEQRARDQRALDLMQTMVATLRNPEQLKKMSLNDLGQCINSSIHGGMHSTFLGARKCQGESDTDTAVSCDDLFPPWSSPVNKHFWKLHGLVDDLIGDWLRAHGKTSIAEDCQGRADCQEWRGKFTGPMPQ